MRSSLLFTNGRLRMRLRPSRHNPSISYSSAATGARRNVNIEESTFSHRHNEFLRKRVLYFSTGPPDNHGRSSAMKWMLSNRSGDGKKHKQQPHKDFQPMTLSPSSLVQSAEMLKENLLDYLAFKNSAVNLPLVSIPSSIMRNRQHRWCSATPINPKLPSVIDSSPPSPLAPPMATMSTSSKTPKLSKEESEIENQDFQVEKTASASLNNDEKDNCSEDNSESNDGKEKGYKRVRTIKVPGYGPDADKAVRLLQIARKERALMKTSINVQRALYGNMLICAAKLGAWVSSGSSCMMSEFIHSVVDCGNQTLLLVGLRHTRNAADKRHPYGYGKAVYFWALVSALGTFFMGAGLSMSHSVQSLFHPTLAESISNEVWFVLAMSFIIDGYVLYKTFSEVEEGRPKGIPMARYISKLRDPATLAVLLEDGAACLGIVIAIAGIGASYATCNPIYDGIAGVGISCLLGGIGLALVRVNHSFLIGQAVEREMLDNIELLIRNRRSIDNVTGIQSQWTGPETFSFKAELDFDGTYLSALLIPRYRAEFRSAGDSLDEDLEVLLSWYAEDVIRAVEREVRHIEAVIRQQYPGAEYIELEPMSKYVDRFAIDDNFEEKLLKIEKKELKNWVRVLYDNKKDGWKTVAINDSSSTNDDSSSGGNVVSGSVLTDTLPDNASGDKPEK